MADRLAQGRGEATAWGGSLADLLLGLFVVGEAPPEAEGFVGRGRDNSLPVWGHGHVEDALGVAGEVSDLVHGRVVPDAELVLGVAMAGDDLLVLLVPEEGGHLGLGVDAVDARARVDVREHNRAVGGTAAGGEEVGLPWAPGEGLDGGGVGRDRRAVLGATLVPDVDNVVVTARGEVLAVVGPLEAADFLGVALEGLSDVLLDADVVVEDIAGAGAGGQGVVVPRGGRDTALATAEGAKLLLGFDVPDLDLGIGRADGEVLAVVNPRDRGHVVGRVGELERELTDVAAAGVPEVDLLAEGNRDDVGAAPFDQVEVEVWAELRGVQDAVWCLRDEPGGGAVDTGAVFLVLGEEDTKVGLVASLWLWGLGLEREDLGVAIGHEVGAHGALELQKGNRGKREKERGPG